MMLVPVSPAKINYAGITLLYNDINQFPAFLITYLMLREAGRFP